MQWSCVRCIVFENMEKKSKLNLILLVRTEIFFYIGLIAKMLLAILFIDSPGISLIGMIFYSSLIIVNW